MRTPFRKALPDGPDMPIRKRRTDCLSPIILHTYGPDLRHRRALDNADGPQPIGHRTENHRAVLSIRQFRHRTEPPSPAQQAPHRPYPPANRSARLHGHPRGYRLESCHRAPVLSSGFASAGRLIGLGRDPGSRNVNPMCRRLRRPRMLSQPARRSTRRSLIGPAQPGAMAPASVSSQMPRFLLELLSNTWGVLPACLGHGTVGRLRRPRIHSGTLALSSAGRDRIELAWGTVPQAR